MNCREFKELADSYLSNELLVETNHAVLRHLESCANCRNALAERRDLRARLRNAVINADESRIDLRFASSVRQELRANMKPTRAVSGFDGFRIAFAGAFGLILIILGVVFMVPRFTGGDVASNPEPSNRTNIVTEQPPDTVYAAFERIRHDAVDDHKNCALTHNLETRPISLDEAAKQFEPANKDLDKTIFEALRASFGDGAELLKAHYCLINGRSFAHVVLRYRGKIVSVLLTRGNPSGSQADSTAKDCGADGPLNISCFETPVFSVFVISDLDQRMNTMLATAIEQPVKLHIRNAPARV